MSKEVERAFSRRIEGTFCISENENEDFCAETEEVVEGWVAENQNRLNPGERVIYKDNPEITQELVKDILKGFKEIPWALGNNSNIFTSGVYKYSYNVCRDL